MPVVRFTLPRGGSAHQVARTTGGTAPAGGNQVEIVIANGASDEDVRWAIERMRRWLLNNRVGA
jgi:hypothetical protein